MIMESKSKSRLTKTNSSSNNNNSSRFLQCFFRPPEIDMDMNVRGCKDGLSLDRDRDRDYRPVFTYVDAGDGSGGGGGNNKEHNGGGGGVEKKKKGGIGGGGGGRKLLRMMRAVMFETSLAKKIRKKKQKQKQCQSGNSDDENKRIISRDSSAITSSSSSSSFSSNPSYHSDRINSFRSNSNHTLERKQKQDSSFHGANTGFCLLFISLFVLVFWGRVCAIICASTWLFFVPGRLSSGNFSSENAVDYAKLDSNKYKKKIIMDGVLERNHSRGL